MEEKSYLKDLFHLSIDLGSTLNLSHETSVFISWLVDKVKPRLILFALTDKYKKELELIHSYGTEIQKPVKIPFGMDLWRWAEKQGIDISVDDAGNRYVVPIPIENQIVGTLVIISGMSMNIVKEKELVSAAAGFFAPVIRNIYRYQTLEEMVRERTAELETVNVRLKEEIQKHKETFKKLHETQQQVIHNERLKALGQLASGIAHDFNNSMTPIVGLSDLILHDRSILQERDKLLSFVKLINTASKDAAETVRRLREFYRYREDDEIFVPVDMNDIVLQAVDLTRPRWKDQALANGVTVEIKTQLKRIPPVMGNETQLREVLTNLILNAINALEKGGLITIKTVQEGQTAVLTVSDNGIGMNEDVKSRCFEPFFTTGKYRGGTGLGLSVVFGIVQRHNGRIDIESKSGEGTTVSVRIPIEKRVQKRDHPASPRKAAEIRPMNVLVVDDEEHVRDVISLYLTEKKCTVETASNGEEGIRKFKDGTYGLVILDRAMPKMNGIQLASLIRQLSEDVPIIMLTGFGDMMNALGEKPDQVNAVLGKPITGDELFQAIVKVIK